MNVYRTIGPLVFVVVVFFCIKAYSVCHWNARFCMAYKNRIGKSVII